nr:ribonuclease H-like domain-containing protein [Tanacetum cinerariifolium]
MLGIKIFSARKKVFREEKKCEKIRAKKSDFLQGWTNIYRQEIPTVTWWQSRRSQIYKGAASRLRSFFVFLWGMLYLKIWIKILHTWWLHLKFSCSNLTQVVKGVTIVMPITSVEEKAQRRLEVKARNTLIMGIINKHQLKFNYIKDAKQLLEAIEKRFGGNAATKNTQRNLLKQQFEKFSAPSSEMLDQTFDRLQNLVSQLELLVNTANGVSTASTQVNAAFSTNIDNLSDAVIFAFLASQPNSPQLAHEDLEQIHPDDVEEMDF